MTRNTKISAAKDVGPIRWIEQEEASDLIKSNSQKGPYPAGYCPFSLRTGLKLYTIVCPGSESPQVKNLNRDVEGKPALRIQPLTHNYGGEETSKSSSVHCKLWKWRSRSLAVREIIVLIGFPVQIPFPKMTMPRIQTPHSGHTFTHNSDRRGRTGLRLPGSQRVVPSGVRKSRSAPRWAGRTLLECRLAQPRAGIVCCTSSARRRFSSDGSTHRSMRRSSTSSSIGSPSRTRASGPPIAASGEQWSTTVPKLDLAARKLTRPGVWDTLRSLLKENLLPPERLKNCLRRAGAAHRVRDIQIDDESISTDLFLRTWKNARQMRERFTVLDLAVLLGVMPDEGEDILAEWVVA